MDLLRPALGSLQAGPPLQLPLPPGPSRRGLPLAASPRPFARAAPLPETPPPPGPLPNFSPFSSLPKSHILGDTSFPSCHIHSRRKVFSDRFSLRSSRWRVRLPSASRVGSAPWGPGALPAVCSQGRPSSRHSAWQGVGAQEHFLMGGLNEWMKPGTNEC